MSEILINGARGSDDKGDKRRLFGIAAPEPVAEAAATLRPQLLLLSFGDTFISREVAV